MGKKREKVIVFKDIKNKRWTIWSQDRKTHLGYADELAMADCVFFVDEKKRQKVLRTKKRLPHAWVIGSIARKIPRRGLRQISYLPFERGFFFETKSRRTRISANFVFLSPDGTVLAS